MPTFPIDSFFDSDFAQPATYINSSSVSKEVKVVYDKDPGISQFGDVQVINTKPMALGKTEDFKDVKKGERLVIHDTMHDEEGNTVQDEAGNDVEVEHIADHYVTDYHHDANGFTDLALSEQAS